LKRQAFPLTFNETSTIQSRSVLINDRTLSGLPGDDARTCARFLSGQF
jgi:hypothetical protein